MVKTFGSRCEVVIHDFKDVSSSVVHVSGRVTNRKIGAPLTNLVLSVLRQYGDDAQDMPLYKNTSKDGKILKSSTTFIRSPEGKIIGAFCVNFDITDILGFSSFIEELTALPEQTNANAQETFASSKNETVESFLEKAIKTMGKIPKAMNREEKIALVVHLDEEGAFLIKGAVEIIAKGMGISKFTIYSYLKEIRGSNGNQNPKKK
jgi:predicted transcriptional regulator YheO